MLDWHSMFLFGTGFMLGAAVVADWLGLKLAKQGDPFWVGWFEMRSLGLWKYKRHGGKQGDSGD